MADAGTYFKPKNYINNLSGLRKTHAIYLGECLKDLSESLHDGLPSVEKFSFGHLFQLKPTRNLYDKLLDLLKEKSIRRQVDHETIISKIDVKPIFDEFLDECSKITIVTDKMRSKIESRSEKIASSMTDILAKTSDLKPNLKDRMDTFVEKIESNKPNFDNIGFSGGKEIVKISPKNVLNNLSGVRKVHGIHLGECLKDISETIHDGLSSAKDKIAFRNVFQMKAGRNLFDKLLDLLKEKAIERQTHREVVISKIDVKPIFDEFLDECGKVVTITNTLRNKIDTKMEKLASTMTEILEKASDFKPNIKDRVDTIAEKIGSNKPNFDNVGLNGGKEIFKILPDKKYDEHDFDYNDY